MSATHSRSGASAVKLRSTRSGAWRPPSLTVVTTNLRRLTLGKTGLRHQPRNTACSQTEISPWRQARHAPVARRRCRASCVRNMDRPRSAPRLSRHAATAATLHPCMIAAGGDTQHAAHRRGDRIVGLVITHEPEPSVGSRSSPEQTRPPPLRGSPAQSRSWRFSPQPRLGSSHSAVVRPPSPPAALRSHCATQFLIDCAVGSNSHAPVPRACGQRAPTQPSDDGTQAGRLLLSWPLWTPRTQNDRCPPNRGNFIPQYGP